VLLSDKFFFLIFSFREAQQICQDQKGVELSLFGES